MPKHSGDRIRIDVYEIGKSCVELREDDSCNLIKFANVRRLGHISLYGSIFLQRGLWAHLIAEIARKLFAPKGIHALDPSKAL
jgi:hypothetical protein